MTSEGEAWVQTLITVTPEEAATLREISDETTVSATPDVQLVLDPSEIVYRRSFTQETFIDARESFADEESKEPSVEIPEEKQKEDAESQTYLQGMPVVHISIEYQDEASQTMYMSTPCPPLKYYRDIMTSMIEGPMPRLKRSYVAGTIISIDPEASRDSAIEQLIADVTDEEREEFESKLSDEEEREMEVTEILHFALARAFWIDDPTSQAPVETEDKSTQTYIKYNNRTKMFVIDSEAQTDLSCEPKKSNTLLLTDYWEKKNIALDCLEDCISKGLEIKIATDDIIDEIIDKCAERIRYPMKEQVIQTIATYKLDQKEKEEDVLRKLKIDIIVDPLEASIVVVPLMDDLLQSVCENVSKNAVKGAKDVLNVILQRTMTIIKKLMELHEEVERKPIDQKLAQRKKKILESMSRRETETIGTQTSIAAISEVKKIKRSREVLCSVCRRQSMCQWCLERQEDEEVPKEDVKILRTQDILLAYKPCYVVTKVSEKDEQLQAPCPPEQKAKPAVPPKYKPRAMTAMTDSVADCCQAIHLFLKRDEEIEPQESVNEWSYVTDATIMKPCSIRESVTSSSQTIVTLLDRSVCPETCSYRSTLSSQAANALQILKDTFCTRETCPGSSLHNLNNFPGEALRIKSTCDVCLSMQSIDSRVCTPCGQQSCKVFSKLHLPNADTYSTCAHVPIKSYGDGFKVMYLSQDSCD